MHTAALKDDHTKAGVRSVTWSAIEGKFRARYMNSVADMLELSQRGHHLCVADGNQTTHTSILSQAA